MAKIILGLGTSHSPQVSQTPNWWADQADIDRKRTPFESLTASAPAWMADELKMPVWQAKHEAVQEAIKALGDRLEAAEPDVVVLIGDDQDELFLDDCLPTFSIFWGQESWDRPQHVHADLSVPSRKAVFWSFHGEEPEPYPCLPDFGRHLVEQMMDAEFDVAQFTRQHEERSLGHAFTFVRRRLMRGDKPIPIVPVFINTYIPPNQPSAGRCYRFGQALRKAIESWPEDLRVAIVASGGLSHFVIDVELDREVLDALAAKDRDRLAAIPREKLQSGSSEILNWITAGGALEGLNMEVLGYYPGYRSTAGTGVGMAFAEWR